MAYSFEHPAELHILMRYQKLLRSKTHYQLTADSGSRIGTCVRAAKPAVLCALLILCFGVFLIVPGVEAGNKLPAVSSDGLQLVSQDGFAAVYASDGADFSNYDAVMLLDCTVEFRKNWQRDQNEEIPFSVKDSDIARIKKDLADEFRKVFSQELTARGEKVVAEAGNDVLVLRPAIVNLDISVPDAMEKIDVRTLTTSAGQMTLYLEIYDSISDKLLARVIDPEQSRDFGNLTVRNEVTNLADANRILIMWSDTLASFLTKARNTLKQTAD